MAEDAPRDRSTRAVGVTPVRRSASGGKSGRRPPYAQGREDVGKPSGSNGHDRPGRPGNPGNPGNPGRSANPVMRPGRPGTRFGHSGRRLGRPGKRSGTGARPGRRRVLVAVLALVLGVLCVAYPIVSNLIAQGRQREVIASYSEAVDNTDEEELADALAEAQSYNERLRSSRAVVTDPFDENADRVTDEDYENALNVNGDGVMGYITIPAISVYLPIYHGTSDDVLEQGVGHLQGTSLPIGGESTHAVLSGHTGLPSMKVFDDLDQLEVGDYFVITVLGEDLAYEVTSIETVLPDETDSLAIQEGEDLVTLVTCTPYGVNTHRLLVHAERCELPDEWLQKGDEAIPDGYSAPADRALLPSVLIGLALAAAVIGFHALIVRIRRGRIYPAGGAHRVQGRVRRRGGGGRASRTRDGPAAGGRHFRGEP